MREMDTQLEISLWHDGKPMTATGIVYTSRIAPGREESWWLASTTGGPNQYQVRIRWSAETGDDWYTGELWLIDQHGCPMGTPRPTLVYTGASDIAMTTAFLCDWSNHPPSRSGVWVVAIRRADNTYKLREKFINE